MLYSMLDSGHLLEIVETLRSRGAHFRSLGDPIDTTGPSGVLVLQMLGAVAEFERSLIRERVKAGLAAAKARVGQGGISASATAIPPSSPP